MKNSRVKIKITKKNSMSSSFVSDINNPEMVESRIIEGNPMNNSQVSISKDALNSFFSKLACS